MPEKTSPGAKLKSNPLLVDSHTINDVLDTLSRAKRGEFTGPGRLPEVAKLGSDFVKVQNVTGSARERGDCLQLGDFLLDETDYRNLWFAADEPAYPNGKCVILQRPLADDEIGPAHASGVCVAKVLVIDEAHTHAMPWHGEYRLFSCTSGPFELLHAPADTGTQLLPVRFLPQRDSAAVTVDGYNGHALDLCANPTSQSLGNTTTAFPIWSGTAYHRFVDGSNIEHVSANPGVPCWVVMGNAGETQSFKYGGDHYTHALWGGSAYPGVYVGDHGGVTGEDGGLFGSEDIRPTYLIKEKVLSLKGRITALSGGWSSYAHYMVEVAQGVEVCALRGLAPQMAGIGDSPTLGVGDYVVVMWLPPMGDVGEDGGAVNNWYVVAGQYDFTDMLEEWGDARYEQL